MLTMSNVVAVVVMREPLSGRLQSVQSVVVVRPTDVQAKGGTVPSKVT